MTHGIVNQPEKMIAQLNDPQTAATDIQICDVNDIYSKNCVPQGSTSPATSTPELRVGHSHTSVRLSEELYLHHVVLSVSVL